MRIAQQGVSTKENNQNASLQPRPFVCLILHNKSYGQQNNFVFEQKRTILHWSGELYSSTKYWILMEISSLPNF